MESLGLHKNATNSNVATDPQYTYICSILESEQPASLDPILSKRNASLHLTESFHFCRNPPYHSRALPVHEGKSLSDLLIDCILTL